MAGGKPRQITFAPWPSYLVAASIPLLYLFQLQVRDQGTLIGLYGLSAPGLEAGQYQELVTFMILHGNWIHVGGNTVFALLFAAAFGGAMTRLMGAGPRGVFAFLGFYVFCGIISGIGFVLANLHSNYVVIGASGAVSGLLGAGGRLFNRARTPGPLLSPGVFAVTAAFLVLNLIISPVQGQAPGDGMPVAWVTHLAGFMTGLFLVGPWATVLGEARQPAAADDAAPMLSDDFIAADPEPAADGPLLDLPPAEAPAPELGHAHAEPVTEGPLP